MKKLISLAAALLLAGASLFAGSLYDDIKGNDLPALKRKVELLEMPLDKEPYLAFYLKNASSFDPAMFAYLLGKGADPNLADAEGVRPLHWAIWKFGAPEVKALLDKGADPAAAVEFSALSGEDKYDREHISLFSPLAADDVYYGISDGDTSFSTAALAVIAEKPDVLALFLDGLDLGQPAWTERDATEKSPLTLLELPLWKKTADYYGRNSQGDAPLSGGSVRCFKELWQKRLSLPEEKRPAFPERYASSLLAVIQDDLPTLKKDLAQDMGNSASYIPYAIIAGSTVSLDFLLRFNDLNANSGLEPSRLETVYGQLGTDNKAPLYAYALLNGDLPMLKWFGERGCDFNKAFFYLFSDGHNQSSATEGALPTALRTGLGDDFVAYLLSKGADPDKADSSTPLALALDARREAAARALLEAGANPNKKARNDLSTFHICVFGSSTELVKAFLAKGADPNLAGPDGFTPLHFAVMAHDLSKVKALVAAKASPAAKATQHTNYERVEVPAGTSPLELARLLQKASNSDSEQKDYQAIIDWLKSQPSKK
jgi:ankyrin repeat protein